MRIPRIHVPAPLRSGSIVTLPEAAANHVARVLRLKPGAQLVLFNGTGGEYQAVLERLNKHQVDVAVGDAIDREAESPLHITLAQGISRGERMDYTIQKAVELGVNHIVPVFCRRSVVNLQGERLDKRVRHWQGVVNSACEQCGRNRLPLVSEPVDLDDWLRRDTAELKLILHPEAPLDLTGVAPPTGPVSLLIGPEGGFAPEEFTQAQDAGYIGLRLGPRILRTETAAVVALSVLQTLWGDLARS